MIKVVSLEKTCGACPAQWEGITDDNRRIYIRYRWGYLRVSIGEIDDMSEYAAISGEEILGKQLGNGLDGVLSFDVLKNNTLSLIEWPEGNYD